MCKVICRMNFIPILTQKKKKRLKRLHEYSCLLEVIISPFAHSAKQDYPFPMGKTAAWGSNAVGLGPNMQEDRSILGPICAFGCETKTGLLLFNSAELCSLSHSQHESLNSCRPDSALHPNRKDSIMYLNIDFLPFFQNKTETRVEVFS